MLTFTCCLLLCFGLTNCASVFHNVRAERGDGRIENTIPETQAFNDLSYVMLSTILGTRLPQSSKDCKPTLLTFGEFDLKLTSRPFGTCKMCCPVNIEKNILFKLYTKEKPNHGTLIRHGQESSARAAGVDSNLQTVFFINGFFEQQPGPAGRTIRDAYFSREQNYNFITVDWSDLSASPWYLEAVRNVAIAAKALKRFLEFYHDSGEIHISKVHLIGFSLGAHVAGFTGKWLRKDLRIPRITGLDPAFPLFKVEDPSKRLASTDAEFVDAIHTDGGLYGIPTAIVQADFFPNSDFGAQKYQPGCTPSNLVARGLIDQMAACSHVRAWRLYAESVRNPKAFPATKCKAWTGANKQCEFTLHAYMGFIANKNPTRGSFYLTTNANRPYARNVQEQKQEVKQS